jgi:hypothetical protein
MDVPHNYAEAATGGHVRRNAESNRGDREGHHHFHPLTLAIAQALAVAPRGQLDARRLPHADKIVTAPTNQRDLLGGSGDAAGQRCSRNGLDALESVIEWCEIPATAARAHNPQPALPLIERDATSDAQTGWATITVKRRVTESTTAKHL